MAVLPTGIGPVTGGYQIERSLRFNSADSAYLNRTPASASNQTTWTLSLWVKRGALNTTQGFFNAGATATTSGYLEISFDSGNTISFYSQSVSGNVFVTTQVFRDPSAWYHIVIAVDTTQATDSNRIKLYVNGTQVTAFSSTSYPSQNANTAVNSTGRHVIGSQNTSGGNLTNYFNGYLTEVNFIDGSAKTPSDFGETDSATGVWKPKAYSGTYGTNGFFLKFADNSGTTSTTLGKDSSGNGNNWTPNNFSVTAGAGNDSLVDSPTAYGTDTGVGGEVRGNYCTLNPLQLAGVSLITLANGNLDIIFATGSGSPAFRNIAGTIGVSSGKWYWEVNYAGGGTFLLVGITDSATLPTKYTGETAGSYAYYSTGQKVNNGSLAAYGASYTTNDVIGVALDMDAGTITFYKNNVSQGQAYSGITGTVFPAIGRDGTSNAQFIQPVNFGQRAFAYTAPSGFKALCTTNLPTPTIEKGGEYFNTVLWTGNGNEPRTITGVGFNPDMVWAKGRSVAYNNIVADIVRGTNANLVTNNTNQEANPTNGLIYNSGGIGQVTTDGFTLVANGTDGDNLNQNAATYVAWNWKANGAGVSNTSGTITSTVSANTTSGFSIVTYTGNDTAGSTVGHGLGAVPSMMIIKERSQVRDWTVYHISTGNTGGTLLNSTGAVNNTRSGWFNNTTPSSSVFTLGGSSGNDWYQTNQTGQTYVAYCFAPVAGYSAFGSYTGNGSSDGPFIFTNFRPRFILIKRSSDVDDWFMYDTARSPYNPMNFVLSPNSSAADTATTNPDNLSNGFKLRSTSGGTNASGSTYIYMALAESPFKFSLAR